MNTISTALSQISAPNQAQNLPMQGMQNNLSQLKPMAQQINQFLAGGKDPMSLIGAMFPNNPVLNMMQGENGLEQAIRQKCQEEGISFDEAYEMAQDAFK